MSAHVAIVGEQHGVVIGDGRFLAHSAHGVSRVATVHVERRFRFDHSFEPRNKGFGVFT